jgi:molybdopterin/thiamine biosynthesis adenylyltransferase
MPENAQRLRVKPEHRPVQVSGGRIRIGGSVYGIAGELSDRTGSVWTLLSAMDGTRTDDELLEQVLVAHPDEDQDAVRAAIQVFSHSGHVEDAAVPDPPELSEREKERYDRGMRFYRWIDMTARTGRWQPQLRLRSARVIVLGVGGTGGNAALALASSGVGELHCVDRDVVELSNLNRQVLFTEADIGRPKVDVAVERLQQLNSDISVTGASLSIGGPGDLEPLAKDCDVLLLCADQPGEIRSWANRACLAARTPWVDAGYHGPVASAAAYRPGQGACYECGWLTEHERQVEAGIEAEYTLVRGGSNAVTAPTAGLSGYLAAQLAISLLTGIVPVRSGLTKGINVIAPDHHFIIEPEQRPDCPACGSAA